MQPQQPYYQPPQSSDGSENTGQYDFILNHGVPQGPVKTVGGPNSTKMIIVVLVGALMLIAVIWIILSLALGGNKGNIPALVGIAQQQAELIRISSFNDGDLQNQDTVYFATNAKITLSTDNKTLTDVLAKNGKKLTTKDLALKTSTATDTALATAKTNGELDSTYVSIMQTELKNYESTLKQTYTASTNQKEKDLLSADFKNAQLLIQQSTQHN